MPVSPAPAMQGPRRKKRLGSERASSLPGPPAQSAPGPGSSVVPAPAPACHQPASGGSASAAPGSRAPRPRGCCWKGGARPPHHASAQGTRRPTALPQQAARTRVPEVPPDPGWAPKPGAKWVQPRTASHREPGLLARVLPEEAGPEAVTGCEALGRPGTLRAARRPAHGPSTPECQADAHQEATPCPAQGWPTPGQRVSQHWVPALCGTTRPVTATS